MSEQYRTWCPDEGETEDDSRLIMGWDEESAAKSHVEDSYHNEPFESPMTVHVRCTRAGSEERVFSVHPEPTISFYAYEVSP